MASYPNFGCLFFLLLTLFFSIQTHARDINHFSQVTRNRDSAPATTNPATTSPATTSPKSYINPDETEFEILNNQEESEQQPAFIPQTTQTGYGLYGHETGLEPRSTPTTTTLYNIDQDNNNNNKYENFNNNNNNNNKYANFNNYNKKIVVDNNDNNNYENFNNYYKNNNNENREKNYATELTGLSDTTYTNVAPRKYSSNNNNNNNNGVQGKFDGGVGYNGVRERQGMSDTRFLENGKYFYDLENEKFSVDHPNNNYLSYSNNNYNTNGYYGNKENNFGEFDNNNNYYYNDNNNNNFYNGKQNQVPEEFDFDQP